MGVDARERTVYRPPGSLGGSDQLLVAGGYRVGLFGKLWEAAVAPSRAGEDRWEDLEIRVLWCDRSIWDSVHAGWWVEAQVARARAEGRAMRNVTTVRFRGANHFVSYCSAWSSIPRLTRSAAVLQAHWDYPAQTLRAFLDDVVDRELSSKRARL